MRQHTFEIHGTQEDPLGNPIPKNRMTLRQRWMPKAKRYVGWKWYIQDSYFRSLGSIDYGVAIRNFRLHKKPIKLEREERAVMDITIYWKDGHHGDPENIFGSIADALFVNDKHLDGSFQSGHAEDGRGRVEIKISIRDS